MKNYHLALLADAVHWQVQEQQTISSFVVAVYDKHERFLLSFEKDTVLIAFARASRVVEFLFPEQCLRKHKSRSQRPVQERSLRKKYLIMISRRRCCSLENTLQRRWRSLPRIPRPSWETRVLVLVLESTLGKEQL